MFEAIDTAATSILSELQTKQAVTLIANSRYAQLFASHDTVPTVATAPKVKASMVRDLDIFPILPALMNFAFRVDAYVSEDEPGWALGIWVTEVGITYLKWFVFGPEAVNYPTGWHSTWDKICQEYGGP